jgi:nucleoside-diphosphate-sugar epimerase
VRSALVTGSAGFLGRHFAAELTGRGYHVSGVDVVDGTDALDVFRTSDVTHDIVVHCAAVEPHRAAIDSQPTHLARNLLLDAAMFGWAVRTRQRRVLYVSSSSAYPIGHQQGGVWKPRLREFDVSLGNAGIGTPDAGYGWAKVTGERMAAGARAAGVPVTVVRPFSGYGEVQDTRWPFGAFAERVRRREDPFVIWGSGEQVRDWVHVSDVVAAALAVVDSGTEDPVNICTGVGTSMLDLVTAMCGHVGYAPEIELLADRPAGVAYRVGDPTLLHRYYTPRVSLAEGVKRALS